MTIFEERIDQLKNTLRHSDLDAIAINAGPDLTYFSGLELHLSERPVILFIGLEEIPVIFFPEFESQKVGSSSVKLAPFGYSEERSRWIPQISRAMDYLGKHKKKIGVNPTSIRFLETQLIQAGAPDLQIISAAALFTQLRQIKDQIELANIKSAITIAQLAIEKTIASFAIGKTEAQIANELVIQLLQAGSDPELPFMPIVAAGENSANPHALSSNRATKEGDLLLIDWGARYKGYVSDMTRTFAIGNIDDELLNMYQIIHDANSAARNVSDIKMSSHQVDNEARTVVQKSGYGEAFTHRTGHGIGLEPHEDPYIQEGNHSILANGMTFTIEPGIYLPRKGGVRIEDDVVVQNGRLVTLTSYPRDLIVLK